MISHFGLIAPVHLSQSTITNIVDILDALNELFKHRFSFEVVRLDDSDKNAFWQWCKKSDARTLLLLSTDGPVPRFLKEQTDNDLGTFKRLSPELSPDERYQAIGFTGSNRSIFHPLNLTNSPVSETTLLLSALQATVLMLRKEFQLQNEAKVLQKTMQQVVRAELLNDDLWGEERVSCQEIYEHIIHVIRSDQWLDQELICSEQNRANPLID